MSDHKREADAIIAEWLREIADRWERGCEQKDMALLDGIPPSPGDITFGDLIEALRRRAGET
jgi:hypothetical protein